MKRVALVCDRKILYHQYSSGIRSVVSCMYYALFNSGYSPDIVCVKVPKRAKIASKQDHPIKSFHYFNVIKFDQTLIYDNFFTNDVQIKSPSLFNYTNLRMLKSNTRVHDSGEEVATDLNVYDVIISVTPWIQPFIGDNHMAKMFTIVYDCFMIDYHFTYKCGEIRSLVTNIGTKMLFKDGNGLICISEYAKEQVVRNYRHTKHFDEKKLFTMQSNIVSPSFYERSCDVKRERAMIIGNIRDKRKRFDYTMKIIPLLQNVDVIYVYGGIATSKKISQFFKSVPKGARVEWYKSASTQKVIEMMHKARVLLFPSNEEGLGLPIIEAQICGARVACQNISPMKDLVIDGLMLTMNPEVDAKVIDGIIADENFDSDGLKRKALEKYNPKQFIDDIKALLSLDNIKEGHC